MLVFIGRECGRKHGAGHFHHPTKVLDTYYESFLKVCRRMPRVGGAAQVDVLELPPKGSCIYMGIC